MKAATIDVVQVRTSVVCFYALISGADVYLVDTGFFGGVKALKRVLGSRGLDVSSIRGILLTHGHLDHTFNARELAHLSGAWIRLPCADASHFHGEHRYKGAARVAGALEWLCAPLSRNRRNVCVEMIQPDDLTPVWDDLVALPFPGHTAGHSVYYSPSRRFLFSGDLFASYGHFSHRPPRVFNDDHDAMLRSFRRVGELDFDLVFPCHANHSSPRQHAEALRLLLKRCGA